MVGYIWLSYKHKVMLLALPMLGLGFLALSGGLRFTIYAVPVMALGIGFLIVQVSSNLKNNYVQYLFISLATVAILTPNIKHAYNYKVPTVFTKDEVVVLDKLKSIASREDYVVGWWDYGYPIRYYSDVKTLSDGGKHSGSVNFPTSFALTNPQLSAAKMLRLDVEYTERNFRIIKEDENLSKKDKRKLPSNIEQMTVNYGYDDTNDFLTSLQTDITLPKSTRDIYLYLPNRMLNIYPTVQIFSNLDLMTGIQKQRPFFYKANRFQDKKEIIDLGKNISVLKREGKVRIENKKIPINKFTITHYNNGKLGVQTQSINPKANLNVIYMKNYNQILLVDNSIYNSTYFKLFVLEQYDKSIFEKVILTPLAKVYKLKI
jgi:undecaprenyl-diphosphooligosaccharide--protein glycosyltransferase